jgi:DNA-binding Lrp family transcriptional regulator
MIAAMGTAPLTADLSLMRELDRARILNLVRQENRLSRAEIAQRTNLSRTTVSNSINQLIEADRIREIQRGTSRGGRRPILLQLNYHAHCCVGLELSTTFLHLVITDLKAEILYQHNVAFDITVGPEQAVQQVRDVVRRALIDAGIDVTEVSSVLVA